MRTLILALWLSLLLSAPSPAEKPQTERPARPHAGHEADSQPLTQVPDLPYLPQYTGKKKFLNGTHWPYQHDGASYIMNFSAAEQPSEVQKWWLESLKNGGWKITVAREGTIVARKAGNSCYLNFMRGGARGDPTKFIVGYHRRDQ